MTKKTNCVCTVLAAITIFYTCVQSWFVLCWSQPLTKVLDSANYFRLRMTSLYIYIYITIYQHKLFYMKTSFSSGESVQCVTPRLGKINYILNLLLHRININTLNLKRHHHHCFAFNPSSSSLSQKNTRFVSRSIRDISFLCTFHFSLCLCPSLSIIARSE